MQWGEAPFRRGRLHNIQVWPNAVICTDGPCIFLLMYTYEIYRLVAVYRPRHKPTLRLPGSSLSGGLHHIQEDRHQIDIVSLVLCIGNPTPEKGKGLRD